MNEVLLEQILSEVKHVKDGQKQINHRLDKLDERLETLDQRMDGLEQRMDGLDQRMDGLEQRTAAVETKLDAVIDQTAFLTEFRNDATDRLDNTASKDDLHYVEAKLLEHDRELFHLKKRA